jgi:hypothetical protein
MNRAAHALFVLRTHERLAHVGTPSDGPAARRGRRITARYLQRAGAGSLGAPLPATAHRCLRRVKATVDPDHVIRSDRFR